MSNNLVINLHSAPIADFDPLPAIEYWLLLKEQWPGGSGTSENKQYGQYYNFTLLLHKLPKYILQALMFYVILMSHSYYSVVGMDKDIAAIDKDAQEIAEVDEKETEAPLQDDNGM